MRWVVALLLPRSLGQLLPLRMTSADCAQRRRLCRRHVAATFVVDYLGRWASSHASSRLLPACGTTAGSRIAARCGHNDRRALVKRSHRTARALPWKHCERGPRSCELSISGSKAVGRLRRRPGDVGSRPASARVHGAAVELMTRAFCRIGLNVCHNGVAFGRSGRGLEQQGRHRASLSHVLAKLI